MNTTDLVAILKEFHRDKLTLRQRHVAVAREVGDYEFNNTYQYVINREDVHLSWLEAAITEIGATPDDVPEPQVPSSGKARKSTAYLSLVAEDVKGTADFVAKWRPRVSSVTNARHRSMMDVVLGETLEQRHFFDLMIAGRDDLLGRRANGPGPSGTGDGVMAVRWIE